jgi:hypothetical protein
MCLETPKQVLENWQKTSLQQLVNTSAFRPFEIASMKMEERQEKKTFINERNMRKRLEFARTYVSKPIDFWKTVFISDERKFNIFDSDGPHYVWRKPKKKKRTGCKIAIPTVKHGEGHTMVWGCMGYAGGENLQLLKGL